MTLRLLAGLCTTLGVTALLWWSHQQHSPAWLIAERMAGQHWYRLLLDDQHIGYLASTTELTTNGSWEFSSELRFAMSAQTPVQIEQSMVFAAAPPHRLLTADYAVKRTDSEQRASVRALPGAAHEYQLETQTQPSTTHTETWDFTLSDHLAFETWLQLEQPPAGARKAVANLDLERLRITQKVFEVISNSGAGFEVRNPAPHADSVIALNRNFIPQQMQLAGLFALEQSTKAVALAERSALQHASYFVPLSRNLVRPKTLERLVLEAHGDDAELWPSPLILLANPVSSNSAPGPEHLAANLQYPADHPRIQALLQSASLPDQPDQSEAQLRQLVRFVHDYLTYETRVNPTPVLDLLDDPVGDCGEFADLLTSLARAAHIPARTVFGLAYTDDPQPALGFHAWNEVAINGRWRAVDPTWNQLRVDATHLLLPANERLALRLLTGHSNVEFEVLAAEHQTSSL